MGCGSCEGRQGEFNLASWTAQIYWAEAPVPVLVRLHFFDNTLSPYYGFPLTFRDNTFIFHNHPQHLFEILQSLTLAALQVQISCSATAKWIIGQAPFTLCLASVFTKEKNAVDVTRKEEVKVKVEKINYKEHILDSLTVWLNNRLQIAQWDGTG